MPAARCTICALNFPEDNEGALCPVCEGYELEYVGNGDPDPPDELRSAINHARFEAEYGPAEVE